MANKITKPEGWDKTEARAIGDFEELEAGGYVLKIIEAEPFTSKFGNEMLILYFDIATGKYEGYFKRLHDRLLKYNDNVKWKGVYYQGISGKSLPFFKGVITSIEGSNKGYKWDWDLDSLKNKVVGGAVGLEEWEHNGKRGFNAKVRYLTGVDAIKKGIKVPDTVYLEPRDDIFDDVLSDFHLMAADDEVPF